MAKLQLKSPRIENRKALHDYFIEDKLECGIELLGSEVKSLRLGLAQIAEAFCDIQGRNLYLQNAHIEPYAQSAIVYNHAPKRPRRLLAHRREIVKLQDQTEGTGMTIVPLAIYFKDGRAKVEIGIARGKKAFDKRATIRKKEADRELRRVMTKRV
jgi:SsrA-binding protein